MALRGIDLAYSTARLESFVEVKMELHKEGNHRCLVNQSNAVEVSRVLIVLRNETLVIDLFQMSSATLCFSSQEWRKELYRK